MKVQNSLLLILLVMFPSHVLLAMDQTTSVRVTLRPIDQIFINACKNNKSLDFALSQGADVNAIDVETGKTGLFYFCERGDFKSVERLLAKGANVNISCNKKIGANTPLFAAILSDNTQIIKLLLEKGADPYVENRNRWNALVFACRMDKLESVKFLAQHTDVNKILLDSDSAFNQAVLGGDPRIITILAQCGANPNLRSGPSQMTPREVAEQSGYKAIAFYLKQLENQKIPKTKSKKQLSLLIPVCDIPVPHPFFRFRDQQILIDRKLFEGCLGNMSIEDMAYCIELGANLNLKDDLGHTPLYYAYSKGFLDKVDLLLAKGADLQGGSIDEVELLCSAAHAGHMGLVQKLIEKNVDVNGKNKSGVTAVYIANIAGHGDVVKILLSAGASPTDLSRTIHKDEKIIKKDASAVNEKKKEHATKKPKKLKKSKKSKKPIEHPAKKSLQKPEKIVVDAPLLPSEAEQINAADLQNIEILDTEIPVLEKRKERKAENVSSIQELPKSGTKPEKKSLVERAQEKVVDVFITPKTKKSFAEVAAAKLDKQAQKQKGEKITYGNLEVTLPEGQRRLMLTNQENPLASISEYSKHVDKKRNDPNDDFHNFPTSVEKELGYLAKEKVLKSATKDHPVKIQYTIPADVNFVGGDNVFPGAFEFIVEYNQLKKKNEMTHRFFKPKEKIEKKKKQLMLPAPTGDKGVAELPK